MKRKINKKTIIILLLLISIGFAYLTSTLDLHGITFLSKQTWDVHFENVQVKEGSVESGTPQIDSNRTTVTFMTNLKVPGDYFEFTVDAKNDGTIDAMIKTYSLTELTEEQQKYLEYIVTYDDGEDIKINHLLKSGKKAPYKVIVRFKKDIGNDNLPLETINNIPFTLTVEYVQADSGAIVRNADKTLYDVLKNEADSNGLARLYTGEHQDSMDASKSTENIYHWYAENDTDGTKILDKNNVLFANHCWQMIRTTDTGGIKLLYNGESTNEEKCTDEGINYIDKSSFNYNTSSPSVVGYTYRSNSVYGKKDLYNRDKLLAYENYYDRYLYSNGVNTIQNGTIINYSLTDYETFGSVDDKTELAGKYTFGTKSTDPEYIGSEIRYIVEATSYGYYYSIILNNGETIDDANYSFTYGDSYRLNADGTYTIDNAQTFKRSEWLDNRGKVLRKFVCKNAVDNKCNELLYVTNTYDYYYDYINITSNEYKYAKGFKYNNKYYLDENSISFWDTTDSENINLLKNAHYTCFNKSGECDKIYYIYYIHAGLGSDSTAYYVELEGGRTILDSLDDDLLGSNAVKSDSLVKRKIDNWYENNLISYSEYLENTIFCNDRSINLLNGWNSNGGNLTISTYPLKFNSPNNLLCSNISYSYSLDNDYAKLKHPIGLSTYQEMNLFNNLAARKTNYAYWIANPVSFENPINNVHGAKIKIVTTSGSFGKTQIDNSYWIRPVISLKPGTRYTKGDGSMNNPYYVKTE